MIYMISIIFILSNNIVKCSLLYSNQPQVLDLQNIFNDTILLDYGYESLHSYLTSFSRKYWSCDGYCGKPTLCYIDCTPSVTLCYCDLECEKYMDCCYNYWKYCKNDSSIKAIDNAAYINQLVQSKSNMSNQSYTPVLMPKEFYFPIFFLQQKTTCMQNYSIISNHTLYEKLCAKENISEYISSGIDQNKLLLSHYDNKTMVIYNNYYCAKCNNVFEGDIIQFDFVANCLDPEFDFQFNNSNQITLQILYENCKIRHLKPSALKFYRIKNIVKESWLDCNSTLNNEQMNIINNIFNKTNQNINSDIQCNLCQIYIMPVKTSFKIFDNLTSSVTFKNIHCFQGWMLKHAFKFYNLDLSYDEYSILSVLKVVNKINYTLSLNFLSVEYEYRSQLLSTVEKINQYDAWYENYGNFTFLYSRIKNITAVLQSQENMYQVSRSYETLWKINGTDYVSVLRYLANQIEETITDEKAINNYDFILKTEYFFDKYILTDDQQQSINILKEKLLAKMMARFNLSSMIYGEPSFSFGLSNVTHTPINISFTFHINGKNLEFVNKKLYCLCLIAKDLYKSGYRFLKLSNMTYVGGTIIYKSSSVNIDQVKSSYEMYHSNKVLSNFNANLDFFYSLSSTILIWRLNSLDVKVPYNTNESSYKDFLYFEIYFNVYGNIFYVYLYKHADLETTVDEVPYNTCAYDLYFINNSLKIINFDDQNKLLLSYNYMNNTFQISSDDYFNYYGDIYFICVRFSDQDLAANLSRFSSHLNASNYQIKFITNSNKAFRGFDVFFLMITWLAILNLHLFVVTLYSL